MLTITPINFSGIRNLPKTNFTTAPKLKNDTFEKSTINFKGSSENDFIAWAKKNGFEEEKIGEAMNNPDNKIGTGFSHSAYSIPENEDYILRIGNSSLYNLSDANWKTAHFVDAQDKNLKVNIGQAVAYIEVDTKTTFPTIIEVAKRQKGESLGVKPYQTLLANEFGKLREGEVPFEDISRKENYARTIHDVASMPIESYEKLIDDLKEASCAGYSFDYLNSNNFLIDKENNAINLIDMEKGSSTIPWDGILYALTNIYYYSTYTSEYGEPPMSQEDKSQATYDTMEIINKFIIAMQNKGEKFDRNNLTYEFHREMSHSIPFLMNFKVFSTEDAFKKLEEMGAM